MTRKEIATMISGIGLPYAYDHFTEADTPGAPPFICFLYTGNDDFVADDANYVRIETLVIELYTDNVDFDLEDAISAALAKNDLSFSMSRSYIDDEKMYQTTFTTEVLIDA